MKTFEDQKSPKQNFEYVFILQKGYKVKINLISDNLFNKTEFLIYGLVIKIIKIVVIAKNIYKKAIFHMLRRNQTRQREIPISEKLKKMFRYSPSYEAQKYYSKLPLRQSNASGNAISRSFKQNEINSEYSSVMQKHFEANECNDTSSWIAKLVSGIQEQDQQNKNFHRLSQIDNKSVNDLPQESQDYGYNQFLLMEQGQSLFAQKECNQDTCIDKLSKEASISRPVKKKSIKDAMLQIQMNQSKQGLKGPPVTTNNSCSKKQNYSKSKPQKSTNSQTKKLIPRMSQDNRLNSNTKSRKSLASQKSKPEIKKKTNTLQKVSQQSIVIQNPNISGNKDHRRKKMESNNIDTTVQYQTCKRQLISTGTKKQNIQRLKYQTEQRPTRKNSFAYHEDKQSKEECNIVEEHSKHLNMKNLFDEINQNEVKINSKKSIPQVQSQVQKRIGGIKKNKLEKDCQQRSKHFISQNIKSNLNNTEQPLQDLQDLTYKPDSMQLLSKRDFNNFTLNKKNQQQFMLNLQSDRLTLASNRQKILENLQFVQKKHSNPPKIQLPSNKEGVKKGQSAQIQRMNAERIRFLFDKIRLDQGNQIVSKGNIKLRGLSEDEKTELGSIISKIHYQSAEFDFKTFDKEFRQMNLECTLRGCLSQQKVRKTNEEDFFSQAIVSLKKEQNQNYPSKHIEKNLLIEQKGDNNGTKRYNYIQKQQQTSEVVQNQGWFEQNCIEQFEMIPESMGHRRRNSKVLNKKLFDQNKASYLEEVALNQMCKNSKVNQNSSINTLQQKIPNSKDNLAQGNYQIISKDPYIEGPSLVDIQNSKRELSTFRTSTTEQMPETLKTNRPILPSSPAPSDENGSCLIQRLNRKLTSYIDKNQIQSTYRQFNLNFSELKKHIR